MLIEAMKSAGPKMMVSSRGEDAAIASTFTSPRAFSIWASMPIRPTSKPIVFSIWVSSRSSALDHRDHVPVGPVRRPVVDPDDARLAAPVAGVEGIHDGVPGTFLDQRRARVLEVQEHLVGGQALGLLQEARAAAGDGQAGPARALAAGRG